MTRMRRMRRMSGRRAHGPLDFLLSASRGARWRDDDGVIAGRAAADGVERDIAGLDDDDYIVKEVEDEAAEAGMLRQMRRDERRLSSSEEAGKKQDSAASKRPAKRRPASQPPASTAAASPSAPAVRASPPVSKAAPRPAAKPASQPSASTASTAAASSAAPAARSAPPVSKAAQRSAASPAAAAAASPPTPPTPSAASFSVPASLSGPPLSFQQRKFAFLLPAAVTEQLLSLSSQTSMPILAAARDPSSTPSSPSCSDSDFVLSFTPDMRHLCLRYADSLENRQKRLDTALPLTAFWQDTVKRLDKLPLIRALGWDRKAQAGPDADAAAEEGRAALRRAAGEAAQRDSPRLV